MKRYLLDTGIAAHYMNRRKGVFERARSEVAKGNVIGVGTPVLGELFFGAENSASKDRNIQQLRKNVPSWRVWPYIESSAEEFGRLAALLVKIGRPMQQIDIMIAAIAFEIGNCTVVSADSDLFAVPGLDVEDWTQP